MNVTSNGVQIRVPAVANLMIDSADRDTAKNPSPFDFLIAKNQSLFNGFFTRIGATEVVLEWNTYNVSDLWENNTIRFTVAGGTVVDISFLPQFMTVENVLDAFVQQLNDATTANRFIVVTILGIVSITDTLNQPITIGTVPGGTNKLAAQLKLLGSGTDIIFPNRPDLRPYRDLDFVSAQLTYNQNLKDSTSSLSDQNVLVRWYFSYDTPTPADAYGFPILMGYEAFSLRRLYNPPKQIAWENNMPIGQIGFQVIGDDGVLLPDISGSQWLMTLQVSEN